MTTQKGYKCYHPSSNFFFCLTFTFNENAIKCIFVGDVSTQKGYKCTIHHLNFFFVPPLLSTKMSLIFPLLIFMGRQNFIEENKDQDFCSNDPFLIDPIDPLKVCDPVFVPLINPIDPLKSV